MYKSLIFDKNIPLSSIDSEKVLKFNNCEIAISNTNLTIKKNNKEILCTVLTLLEEDFFKISYVGKHLNGDEFRVMRPKGFTLLNIKQQFDCEAVFCIASRSSNDYAIHFILTQKDKRINSSFLIEKGKKEKTEKIQRLIGGAITALEMNLPNNFIYFSKLIMGLICDINELSKYTNGIEIMAALEENQFDYSENR